MRGDTVTTAPQAGVNKAIAAGSTRTESAVRMSLSRACLDLYGGDFVFASEDLKVWEHDPRRAAILVAMRDDRRPGARFRQVHLHVYHPTHVQPGWERPRESLATIAVRYTRTPLLLIASSDELHALFEARARAQHFRPIEE